MRRCLTPPEVVYPRWYIDEDVKANGDIVVTLTVEAPLHVFADCLAARAKPGPMGLRVLVEPTMPPDELLMFSVVGEGRERHVEAAMLKGIGQ